MDKFEQWYLDTYYKPHGVVPPINLFKRYEGTYLIDDVYRQNLVWQHQQAKVEELQKQLNEYIFVAETLDEMYVKEVKSSDELQKRVQFLEQELGAWKGNSIAAMINGMCGQCGKEPWQAIRSNKDGYALLHCFGCGANKYELMGEQALKGGA
ncbi:hypothetical protein ACG9XP_18890 [Acinetobacter baumannii]|uniref:hypothetical protein n=1 Tax=Acinetobacter baumannii TaxID=470 RepID=UPI003AF5C0CE